MPLYEAGIFEDMEPDKPSGYRRGHDLQDCKINEEELAHNHFVRGYASLLQEKTKYDSEQEAKHDLRPFIFMKRYEFHWVSPDPGDPEQKHGHGNAPDKKAECREDTTNRKLQGTIDTVSARTTASPP